MPEHTPEHKEQTQQGGMGGEKQQPDWQKRQQGDQREGDMGGQQPLGGDRERREESQRTNS